MRNSCIPGMTDQLFKRFKTEQNAFQFSHIPAAQTDNVVLLFVLSWCVMNNRLYLKEQLGDFFSQTVFSMLLEAFSVRTVRGVIDKGNM